MLGQRQRAVLGALAAHGGWRAGDAPIVGTAYNTLQVLGSLAGHGLVREAVAHPAGGGRSRIVHEITDAGAAAAFRHRVVPASIPPARMHELVAMAIRAGFGPKADAA